MKNDNEKLVENLLKVVAIDEMEKSNLKIKIYNAKIEYYGTLLDNLEKHKPFKFQKKKLNDFNKKQEEYLSKMNEIYSKMGEEVDDVIKISELL